MTEESAVLLSQRRGRDWLLAVLAVPVGGLIAWGALLAALYVPTDRPTVWLGLPLLAVAAVAGVVGLRSRALGLALASSGVLVLVFFAWLFWQFGQGMEGVE